MPRMCANLCVTCAVNVVVVVEYPPTGTAMMSLDDDAVTDTHTYEDTVLLRHAYTHDPSIMDGPFCFMYR